MRKGFLGSLALWLGSTALALGQGDVPDHPQTPAAEAAPVAPGQPLLYDEVPDFVPPPPLHERNPPRHGPPGYRFYGRADYLLWWVSKHTSPPLLSTGPLGAPGTVVLLDDITFDNQMRQGTRLTWGAWLDECQSVGLEATGLWLFERDPVFRTAAPGNGVLQVPFFDPNLQAESAFPLALPGVSSGAVAIDTPSQLWGVEANLRKELFRSQCCHVDLLAGFRFLELDEGLHQRGVTTFAPGVPGIGGRNVLVSDRFGTRNRFYGGQIGGEAEFHWGRWSLDLWGKMAIGGTAQQVNINGTAVVIDPAGGARAFPGGLFAQPTNSGNHTRGEFTFLPDVGVNVGAQLTTHLKLTVGYTFLYFFNAVRPGDQIDRTVNPTQRVTAAGVQGALVGEARPTFSFRESDFWAQGLNFGLEFRY